MLLTVSTNNVENPRCRKSVGERMGYLIKNKGDCAEDKEESVKHFERRDSFVRISVQPAPEGPISESGGWGYGRVRLAGI